MDPRPWHVIEPWGTANFTRFEDAVTWVWKRLNEYGRLVERVTAR